jgi:hypothetical protein
MNYQTRNIANMGCTDQYCQYESNMIFESVSNGFTNNIIWECLNGKLVDKPRDQKVHK